jgi:hypothetical protein
MNAQGFVEVSLVKGELLYRAMLPIGIPWSQAGDALREMAVQIDEHVKTVEEQDRLKKEQEAAAPIEADIIHE